MLKKLLISAGEQSVRFLHKSYRKRANYLVKRLEVPNFQVCLKRIKPISFASRNYIIRFRKENTNKKAEVKESELAEAFNIDTLRSDFASPVEHFKERLKYQTENPRMKDIIESFEVEFDGYMYKIRDLAVVGKKSPSFYVLHFDEAPRSLPAALKALRASGLKCSIQLEGTKLHVEVPDTQKIDKDTMKKQCKKYLTQCKDELYFVQNIYLRNLKKQDSLSIERRFKLQDQLNTLTEQMSKEAEMYLGRKMVELLKREEQ